MPTPTDSRSAALARMGLPSGISRLAVVLVLIGLGASLISIEVTRDVLAGAKAWAVGHFDTLFVVVVNGSIASVLLVAFHPVGRLRLGPPESRPEFGGLAWFAMLFSAGLASGLLYWATAEPIIHLQSNPWLGGASTPGEAVATAMRITVLHWGLHGWALYALAGLSLAIYAYRHDRPLTFRTALFPILGPKWIDRWPGRSVDLLALLGTVCGVATSIGLSAGSLNATLSSLFGVSVGTGNQIAIIFVVCTLGIISAISGLARGIRRLSEVNVGVSLGLLCGFLVLGPTRDLGALFVGTVGDFLLHGIPAGLWVAETPSDRAWQADWTIFYWAWWLAWTPFVSLFIARISKGRTLREFALAVLLVPTFVTWIWMVIIGGTAIGQETAAVGSISEIVNGDYSLGLVAVIEGLGSPAAARGLIWVAAFLLFTWLITSLDSATLVICQLLGAEESAPAKIFWGLAMAAVAAVLLRAGGLDALQAASIVIGVPLAVLMVLLAGGLLRDLFRGRI